MIEYNAPDVRRVNHSLKVLGYAQYLARAERCAPDTARIIEAAAILHDIGIHVAERVHGSSAGNWQEIEGPPIARRMLADIGADPRFTDRVAFIVGHHHSYAKIDAIDFQILVEADFLVNASEDSLDRDQILSFKKNVFRTHAGTELLSKLFLQ